MAGVDPRTPAVVELKFTRGLSILREADPLRTYEAEECLLEAHSQQVQMWGPHHPVTLPAAKALVEAHLRQDRLTRACALCEEVGVLRAAVLWF